MQPVIPKEVLDVISTLVDTKSSGGDIPLSILKENKIFPQVLCKWINNSLKDTNREKAPSNESPATRKSTNISVWAVGTLNQLFIRGS